MALGHPSKRNYFFSDIVGHVAGNTEAGASCKDYEEKRYRFMGRKLPALKPRVVINALVRNGFYIHHVKGSHHFLRKGEINLVIPLHNKDMKPGMLHGIIRQCGLTVEEFLDLL